MLYISDYIKALSGYDPSDFLTGKIKYADIIHPDDTNLVNEAIQLSDKIQTAFNTEYRIVDKNKKIHWVWDTGIVSKDNGHLFGLILEAFGYKLFFNF